MRSEPTSKRTVTMAIPGREAEYTYSAPLISAITCSAGVATRDSTSSAEAPGKGMKMSTRGTLIWGSSSRGVRVTASTPASRAIRPSRGVIRARMNRAAMRPLIPWVCSAMGVP